MKEKGRKEGIIPVQKHEDNRIIPPDIGGRLRKIRKGKGATLQSLAEETGFSIGKLSNIERGAQKPTLQDIETMCSCLGVKLDQVIRRPLNTEVVERIKADMTLVSIYLSLNLLSTAESLLSTIHNKVESLDLNELLPSVYFSWGDYYLKIKDYIKASTYFKKVINSKASNEEIYKFRVKSLNALSTLEFAQSDIHSALHFFEMAERVCTNPEMNVEIEERVNTFFNGAVLNLHINRLDHALKYCYEIETITKGKMFELSKFIQGIIFYLKKKPHEAINNITGCMSYFRSENDVEYLILSLNALYVIYKSDPMNYQHLISIIENEVVQELIEQKAPPYSQQKTVEFFHLLISMLLKDRNLEFAEKLLHQSDLRLEQINDPNLSYKSFHLWANYYRILKHKDKEIYFLKKALKQTEEDSIENALVLTELGFAQEEKGPYFEAIEIFYKVFSEQYQTMHHSLIPNPRF